MLYYGILTIRTNVPNSMEFYQDILHLEIK